MSEPKKPVSVWKIVGYSFAVSLFLAAAVALLIPHFVHARSYSGGSCIHNLRVIDSAKQQWALENPTRTNEMPTIAGLSIYLAHNKFPVCPRGGKYTVGHIGENPTCTVPDHVLPAP